MHKSSSSPQQNKPCVHQWVYTSSLVWLAPHSSIHHLNSSCLSLRRREPITVFSLYYQNKQQNRGWVGWVPFLNQGPWFLTVRHWQICFIISYIEWISNLFSESPFPSPRSFFGAKFRGKHRRKLLVKMTTDINSSRLNELMSSR